MIWNIQHCIFIVYFIYINVRQEYSLCAFEWWRQIFFHENRKMKMQAHAYPFNWLVIDLSTHGSGHAGVSIVQCISGHIRFTQLKSDLTTFPSDFTEYYNSGYYDVHIRHNNMQNVNYLLIFRFCKCTQITYNHLYWNVSILTTS